MKRPLMNLKTDPVHLHLRPRCRIAKDEIERREPLIIWSVVPIYLAAREKDALLKTTRLMRRQGQHRNIEVVITFRRSQVGFTCRQWNQLPAPTFGRS
jgi:hypothetical protein